MGPNIPGQAAQDLEYLLADLGQSPADTLIRDQLLALLGEWRIVHAALPWRRLKATVTHGYTTLIALVLDQLARDPSPEPLMRLCARLNELRRAFPAAALATSLPAEVGLARPAAAWDDVQVMEHLLQEAVRRLAEALRQQARRPPPSAPPAAAAAAAVCAGKRAEEQPQRGDYVYRQPRAHPREEIEKLQKTLGRKVSEALEQNKKFGDLLRIVRGALLQASTGEEITRLREIVIGSIGELLEGQQQLARDLNATGEYLHQLAADSDRLHEELRKVRELSLTDEFTGLPNRRAFLRRLDEEIGRAQRYGTPLALAILDLDEFKTVNDTYGHSAGDAVLRCYAEKILLPNFRHYDMVARYGGEEFSALLPNTEKEGALQALRKVQIRAANTRCEYGGAPRVVPTFSAGLTLYVPGESADSLITRADRALYRAKRLGRDRIETEIPLGQGAGGAEEANRP